MPFALSYGYRAKLSARESGSLAWPDLRGEWLDGGSLDGGSVGRGEFGRGEIGRGEFGRGRVWTGERLDGGEVGRGVRGGRGVKEKVWSLSPLFRVPRRNKRCGLAVVVMAYPARVFAMLYERSWATHGLRPLQEEAVRRFVEGRDVFVSFPTGGGKSLCYSVLPLVFDKLRKTAGQSLVIVASPLIALMKDQVRALAERNAFEFQMAGVPQFVRTVDS